jgi:hypothetical protein
MATTETALYIGTAVLTILWSVWTYLVWSDKSALQEFSGKRFYLIAAPSGYFLLLALSGWQKAQVIRLDLVGIAAYDAVIVVSWLALLIARALRLGEFKRAYVGILTFYNVLSILLLAAVYLVRFFPPLLIRVAALLRQGVHLEFFRFAWVGLDPTRHEQDLVSVANKALIAVISYIPVTVFRALYVNRQMSRHRRHLNEEIDELKRRVSELERRHKG